jgi:hypothetical protein
MLTKLTIIFAKIEKKRQIFSDEYFMLFLNKENKLPSETVTQSGISACMDKIFGKYFKIDKHWPNIKLSDARVYLDSGKLTTELVYTCFIPSVWSIEKTGGFYTRKTINDLSIKIDPFLLDVISKQSASVYR